jgi:hypothetical protein
VRPCLVRVSENKNITGGLTDHYDTQRSWLEKSRNRCDALKEVQVQLEVLFRVTSGGFPMNVLGKAAVSFKLSEFDSEENWSSLAKVPQAAAGARGLAPESEPNHRGFKLSPVIMWLCTEFTILSSQSPACVMLHWQRLRIHLLCSMIIHLSIESSFNK